MKNWLLPQLKIICPFFLKVGAQQLDGYGQECFLARDERGTEVLIGASLTGIVIRQGNGENMSSKKSSAFDFEFFFQEPTLNFSNGMTSPILSITNVILESNVKIMNEVCNLFWMNLIQLNMFGKCVSCTSFKKSLSNIDLTVWNPKH